MKDFNKNYFFCIDCKLEKKIKINLDKNFSCDNCGGKIFKKKYSVGEKYIIE